MARPLPKGYPPILYIPCVREVTDPADLEVPEHHAPIRLGWRCGSVRRTVIARGPPSGTSRGASSSMPPRSAVTQVVST